MLGQRVLQAPALHPLAKQIADDASAVREGVSLTLVTEIYGKSAGPGLSTTRLIASRKQRVERVNVENLPDWSLQPGAERNAVGGALRRALVARFNHLPGELEALLAQLGRRPSSGRGSDVPSDAEEGSL